jgi:hypothetical protein
MIQSVLLLAAEITGRRHSERIFHCRPAQASLKSFLATASCHRLAESAMRCQMTCIGWRHRCGTGAAHLRNADDVIDDAVGEAWRRCHHQHCVSGDGTRHSRRRHSEVAARWHLHRDNACLGTLLRTASVCTGCSSEERSRTLDWMPLHL